MDIHEGKVVPGLKRKRLDRRPGERRAKKSGAAGITIQESRRLSLPSGSPPSIRRTPMLETGLNLKINARGMNGTSRSPVRES